MISNISYSRFSFLHKDILCHCVNNVYLNNHYSKNVYMMCINLIFHNIYNNNH